MAEMFIHLQGVYLVATHSSALCAAPETHPCVEPSSWMLVWYMLSREAGDAYGVAIMFVVYTMLGLLLGTIIGFAVISHPQPGAPF